MTNDLEIWAMQLEDVPSLLRSGRELVRGTAAGDITSIENLLTERQFA